ncbi:MAG: LysR substrate-binding domain-containing protein, partial [Burkholderiaceae bacterium]
ADVTVLSTAHQPFCALVARTHPLATRSSLRLRDCQAYPIALADETLAGRALIDRALLKTSFQFEPALVSNSIEVMKAFSRTSNAICFQFQIGPQVDDDMIAIPLTDDGLARTQLFLAMRRGRALPSAAAAFSEHLAAMLQDL